MDSSSGPATQIETGQRQRGDYNYNSPQLFLEDFSPDNFGKRSAGSVTYYGNQKAVYWYANDNWKVNPHLALNPGIRYRKLLGAKKPIRGRLERHALIARSVSW